MKNENIKKQKSQRKNEIETYTGFSLPETARKFFFFKKCQKESRSN